MSSTGKEAEFDANESMGRSAKLGLAVIGVLLVAFIAVLVMKLSGSNEPAAVNDFKPNANQQASARGNQNGATKSNDGFLASVVKKPTVAPLKNGPERTGHHSHWANVADNTQDPASGSNAAALMPKTGEGVRRAALTVMPAPPAPTPDVDLAPSPSSYKNGTQTASNDGYDQYGQYRNRYSDGSSGYSEAGTAGSYRYSQDPYRNDSSAGNSTYQGANASNPYRNDYAQSGQTRDGYSHGYGRYNNSPSDNSRYQEAPCEQKVARPYDMPNRVSPNAQNDPYRNQYGSNYSSNYGSNSSSSYGNEYGSGTFGSQGGRFGPQADGTYVVQPGDSFSAISKRLYGTDAYFRALAEHNRSKFSDENDLRVGDSILAPGESELEQKYPDLCPSPERRKTMRSRMTAVSTTNNYRTGPTYTVQEGDTLFDIARFKLGEGSRWPEIYQLNFDSLQEDFNYLTPGMQLSLPEEPTDTVTRRPSPYGTR